MVTVNIREDSPLAASPFTSEHHLGHREDWEDWRQIDEPRSAINFVNFAGR
jgi:hypothetical protein